MSLNIPHKILSKYESTFMVAPFPDGAMEYSVLSRQVVIIAREIKAIHPRVMRALKRSGVDVNFTEMMDITDKVIFNIENCTIKRSDYIQKYAHITSCFFEELMYTLVEHEYKIYPQTERVFEIINKAWPTWKEWFERKTSELDDDDSSGDEAVESDENKSTILELQSVLADCRLIIDSDSTPVTYSYQQDDASEVYSFEETILENESSAVT